MTSAIPNRNAPMASMRVLERRSSNAKKMQSERRLGIRSKRVLAVAKPLLASVLKTCLLVLSPMA